MAAISSLSSSASLHLRSKPTYLPRPILPRNRHRLRRTAATPPISDLRSSDAPLNGVAEHVKVLKEAAKTRRVAAGEVLSSLAAIQNAAKRGDVDSSGFLETLGGTESPGRTWMLVFTAQGSRLDKGRYFPITAVQRFDAAAKRIENGVYLGPLGCLTFEGRFSWKKKVLAFIFECMRIKIGPLGPLQINFGKGEDREPGNKDPFFVWFYIDEEIAVARGRSGGTAYWCRCGRVT